jgi:hypothetical protein
MSAANTRRVDTFMSSGIRRLVVDAWLEFDDVLALMSIGPFI